MNYSIVAEQVCKQFKDNLALDNVDLKVESGSICGLVGRKRQRQNRSYEVYMRSYAAYIGENYRERKDDRHGR